MHDATVKEHAAQQRAAQLRAEAAAVSTMSTQSTMIMMCTVIGGDGDDDGVDDNSFDQGGAGSAGVGHAYSLAWYAGGGRGSGGGEPAG
jgi:hypothetical protein